jgi:hypothetical protein
MSFGFRTIVKDQFANKYSFWTTAMEDKEILKLSNNSENEDSVITVAKKILANKYSSWTNEMENDLIEALTNN